MEQRFTYLCDGSRRSSSALTRAAQILDPLSRLAAHGKRVIAEQETSGLVPARQAEVRSFHVCPKPEP